MENEQKNTRRAEKEEREGKRGNSVKGAARIEQQKKRTNFVRRAQSRASKANPKVRPDAKLISFFAREVMAPVKFALLLLPIKLSLN